MKINIVVPFFYPIVGGAEVYAFELATRLSKRGYQVRVHTSIFSLSNKRFSEYEEIDGVKIFRYKPYFRKYYYYWFWLPKIVDTDLIHVMGYGHMCFSLTIHKYHKKFPIVTTPIGVSALIEGPKSRWLRKQYDNFVGIRQLKLCQKIIVWANEEKEWCIKKGILEKTIEKIPIGIPEESFSNYNSEDVKIKYNLKDYVLYLGRIHVQKGILELLNAFYLVLQKFNSVDLVLVGPDNGYLKEVKNFAKSFKLEQRIKWIPTLLGKEKYKIINGSKYLILPSKYELQGIVLVEAMAQGKPVIATNVGGIPDFVKDGVNGFLVNYGDVETLANRMLILLTDDNLREKMGENARITAEEYQWDKIIDKYEKVYKEVLNKC
jgi:glycosyltransferase involved in cell wall biosynthesis